MPLTSLEKITKISDRERKCLVVLAEIFDHDGNCTYFRHIAKKTRLNEVQVRRSVRSLARKGLAQYTRGLFDDEGMVAGSGYCATFAGAMLINGCTGCKNNIADMIGGLCNDCWQKKNKKSND